MFAWWKCRHQPHLNCTMYIELIVNEESGNILGHQDGLFVHSPRFCVCVHVFPIWTCAVWLIMCVQNIFLTEYHQFWKCQPSQLKINIYVTKNSYCRTRTRKKREYSDRIIVRLRFFLKENFFITSLHTFIPLYFDFSNIFLRLFAAIDNYLII